MRDFLIGHDLMAGDREFLVVDLLRDGQFKSIPLRIAFLLVGRNGIMDHGLHTIVGEVLLELVTMGTEDSEDVIDAIAGGLDYSHEGIAYFSLIAGSNLLTTGIIGIEMTELDIEDGSLDLIDARVAP